MTIGGSPGIPAWPVNSGSKNAGATMSRNSANAAGMTLATWTARRNSRPPSAWPGVGQPWVVTGSPGARCGGAGGGPGIPSLVIDQRSATNPSTDTVGCPAVPTTTILIVWVALDDHVRRQATTLEDGALAVRLNVL